MKPAGSQENMLPIPHILLLLFYTWNAANAFFPDFSLSSCARFFLPFAMAAGILYFLCRLAIREPARAMLLSLFIYGYILFTRAAYVGYHDLLGRASRTSYREFFGVSAVLGALVIYLCLRVSISGIRQFLRYVYILLAVLLLYEAGTSLYKTINPSATLQLRFTDLPELPSPGNMKKPDIYFFLFDEYSGNDALQAILGIDNHKLGDSLRARGFFYADSSQSDYSYTSFSVPSIFNMGRLQFNSADLNRHQAMRLKGLLSLRDHNLLLEWLQGAGYTTVNRSPFHLKGNPSAYLDFQTEKDGYNILYNRTLPGVLRGNALHAIHRNSVQVAFNTFFYQWYAYNQDMLKKIHRTIDTDSTHPKFVYAHLFLPHSPVHTDSAGRFRNFADIMNHQHPKDPLFREAYATYLGYTNRQMLELVDRVRAKDPGAVIVIASDHGIRAGSPFDRYNMHNQVAVFIPGQRYVGFTDSLHAVNLFRLVLNNTFGTHIPLLPKENGR